MHNQAELFKESLIYYRDSVFSRLDSSDIFS